MTDHSPGRIAIFIPSLGGGGVEMNMVNLARAFVDQGYEVDLVAAGARGPFREYVDPRVRLVDLNSRRVLFALPGLVRYLRRRRPGILLAGMGHANLVALAARWFSGISCRVVVSVHTVLSKHLGDPELKRTSLVPFLARFAYPHAAGIIAVSPGVAEDLANLSRLPRERITVIGNPVVTPQMRTEFAARPEHRFFGVGKPPVVISVGRMVSSKGFDVLLKAHALLRITVPHNLLILGEGPERLLLEELVTGLDVRDSVDLPGFVEGVPGYLAQADLFVLAARFEGFGNVLIEAMAAGLPVVATDCSGGPGFILEDGRYGPLVPVDDPQALAGAMAGVLAGSPDGRQVRERAEDFSLEKIADEYLTLFRGYGGGDDFPSGA